MRSTILFVVMGLAGCLESTGDSNNAVESGGEENGNGGGGGGGGGGGEVCESWEVCDPIEIWPPNHKLKQFTLDDCVKVTQDTCPSHSICGNQIVEEGEECDDGNNVPNDGCNECKFADDDGEDKRDPTPPAKISASEAELRITSITSDEPIDVKQGGDGSTKGFDAVIVDDITFKLRAERQGGGDGRVYEVNFVDGDGVAGKCTFFVEHDGCDH